MKRVILIALFVSAAIVLKVYASHVGDPVHIMQAWIWDNHLSSGGDKSLLFQSQHDGWEFVDTDEVITGFTYAGSWLDVPTNEWATIDSFNSYDNTNTLLRFETEIRPLLDRYMRYGTTNEVLNVQDLTTELRKAQADIQDLKDRLDAASIP
jgi:hypothetical protein